MEEWKEYKLGEVCKSIVDGDHMPPPKSNGGIPFVTISNIVGNRLDFRNTYFVPQTYYDGLDDKRRPHVGDTLYSVVGTFGIPVYIKEEKPFVFQRHIAILRPDESIIEPLFLFYTMLSPQFYRKADVMALGAVQRTISLTSLRNAKIQLPSPKIQSKIADILSSIDDKIEVNNRINDNLEQQAQALFKSWFVDFEPFRDQPFEESELGLIPKGWRVDNIYQYIDVFYGAPYKSSLFNVGKKGLPLIRIRDLKNCTPQVYTPEILPTTEYIETGDVVAGMDAEFVPHLWFGEKGVLNQRCCKFKSNIEDISNYFILYFIKPQLEFVQSYKTGTTVSHLGKSDIDRFKFITPPLDVVLDFSKIVNPIKEHAVIIANESRRLSELRDVLLPRLMSGIIKMEYITM